METKLTINELVAKVLMEVVTQDIPVRDEDTDLLNWLQDFCR